MLLIFDRIGSEVEESKRFDSDPGDLSTPSLHDSLQYHRDG